MRNQKNKSQGTGTANAVGYASLGYASLALVSLAIALVVGWWIAVATEVLGPRFDKAYYVLLVILGLSAALVLFGVMRSTARVTGRHLGVAVEVGGAAGLFVIVVVGGFWLTQPAATFNTKIRLHYTGPQVDRQAFESALPQSMLRVSYGLNTQEHKISHAGEVTLWDVPQRFRNGKLMIEMLDGPIELVVHQPRLEVSFPSSDEPIRLQARLRPRIIEPRATEANGQEHGRVVKEVPTQVPEEAAVAWERLPDSSLENTSRRPIPTFRSPDPKEAIGQIDPQSIVPKGGIKKPVERARIGEMVWYKFAIDDRAYRYVPEGVDLRCKSGDRNCPPLGRSEIFPKGSTTGDPEHSLAEQVPEESAIP